MDNEEDHETEKERASALTVYYCELLRNSLAAHSSFPGKPPLPLGHTLPSRRVAQALPGYFKPDTMEMKRQYFQGMQLSLPKSLWLMSDPQILSKHPCYLKSTQKKKCYTYETPTPALDLPPTPTPLKKPPAELVHVPNFHLGNLDR